MTAVDAICDEPYRALGHAIEQLKAAKELHAAAELERDRRRLAKTISRIRERVQRAAEIEVRSRASVVGGLYPDGTELLSIDIPIHTVSEPNRRDHWAKKHRERGDIRPCVEMVVRAHANRKRLKLRPPARVLLERHAPHELDTDNLQSALKAVRDGVADAMGADDSGSSGLVFTYGQCATPRFGVCVRIRTVKEDERA